MARASIEDRLKQILVRLLNLKLQSVNIDNEQPLVNQGLALDSITLLEIVVAIESEFKVSVDDEDINRELFENVNSLADYVRKKMESR